MNPLDLFDLRSALSEEEQMVQDSVARLVDARVLPIIQDLLVRHPGLSVRLSLSDRMVKIDQLVELKDNVNLIARGIRNIVLLDDNPALAVALNEGDGTAEFITSDKFSGESSLRITPPQRFSSQPTLRQTGHLETVNCPESNRAFRPLAIWRMCSIE